MTSSEGGRTGGRSHSDELSHDAQVRQRKLSTGSVTDNAAYWQMLQTAKPPGRSFALAVGAYSALPSRPKKAQRRCGGFLPLRAQASLLQDEARRIAANVAKLPMLLVERSRHQTDERT